MKNIAVIATSLNSGGAERIAGLLSKELSKYYNVYIFLLSTENIVYEYEGTIVDVGPYVQKCEYLIKKYKILYQIEIAISFLELMNFANIRTCGKEKVIISERCVQSLFDPPRISETYKIKKYYDFADEIISCSEGVKYDLIHNYGINNKITTIYNFIDKRAIILKSYETFDSEVQAFLNGAEYFVNVGRLDRQKNQKRLILQFLYFHTINPNVKLLIIGSGELKEVLISYIAELGLNESIKIIPYTTNPFRYMLKAKSLILSSHHEGLPNVVLEAMTLGCPVIATDCLSGPRELLIDETDYEKKVDKLIIGKRGILVCDDPSEDDGSSRYMAEAMALLYSSACLSEQFRINGQEYMEPYSNEEIVNKWVYAIENCEKKKSINALEKERYLLDAAKHIVIYGAGMVGKKVFLQLSKHYKIDCFTVSKRKPEETELFGLPILEISELKYSPDNTVVMVAVSENYQSDILMMLEKYGFWQIVFPYIEYPEDD